ncbi:hypothetical protein MM1S1540310_3145 [Mycobacteroides abscessus subsp. bolletii 1S-154-0310]|nr:hypothetical protein [Mycobacteroides abscessus]EIU63247.1 hypothetical protein MM1S1510930_3588 [Mycobacteroides abscessus subsp. bolletii 1S-151-0930]EIU69308.1 hypothetical protein MM1S1520914_3794 [Mycobacteroides abscessus subsp. bolletii 1S-152-0914]EIU73827.1 hypothetical protein MM1S1530915_3138 [Mycobacteroides abscessus subsp. bolletii 1S-153-0915]EIU79567.1 hypothetical protein MM1S1540310_3145 [Mycobacteroides abscessus subsp. bolletii 1S-154-0310]MBE5481565.1 hypothetical prote
MSYELSPEADELCRLWAEQAPPLTDEQRAVIRAAFAGGTTVADRQVGAA